MNISSITLSSLALASLIASTSAQSVSGGQNYYKSWGDSDAGAVVSASASYYGRRTSDRIYTGSGPFKLIQDRERLTGVGNASAYADLRLLGERKRAAYFRLNLSVNAEILRSTRGTINSQSCTQNGSVYMKVGNTVLWNWKLGSVFEARRDYRVRIMTPTLVVWFGGGALVAKASGYGRINTDVRAVLLPCYGFLHMNGNARLSGNASFSASVYSILAAANVSGSFYAKDQRLEMSNFYVRPSVSSSSSWVKGLIRLHSGAMRGYIKLNAILPPFIPVSTTLANWSKAATVKTLFNK